MIVVKDAIMDDPRGMLGGSAGEGNQEAAPRAEAGATPPAAPRAPA